MTKEDIKKAKAENAERIANIAYSGGGHIGQDDLETAFENGADWRINSVWHDASETPISGKYALVKYITGDLKIKYRVDVFCGYEWKEMCHYDKLIQFAYIEDLIPNVEEQS